MKVLTVGLLVAVLSLPHARATAQSLCMGDCDGNGYVTVDEVLTMVNSALGNGATCPTGNGDATIEEIIAAVNNALQGCSGPKDWSPFVELAIRFSEETGCADRRNALYVIDGTFVFWVTEGNCGDALYHYTLFDAAPSFVVCEEYDTIAGPRGECYADQELFDAIVANLDAPDLGLGPRHAVRRLELTLPPTPTPTPCTSGPGIHGQVFAPGFHGLEGATVACESPDGSVTTTTSSSNGWYSLPLILGGRYRCSASHSGFGVAFRSNGFEAVNDPCFDTSNFFLLPGTPVATATPPVPEATPTFTPMPTACLTGDGCDAVWMVRIPCRQCEGCDALVRALDSERLALDQVAGTGVYGSCTLLGDWRRLVPSGVQVVDTRFECPEVTCAACGCPAGPIIYVLVEPADVDPMIAAGWFRDS